MDLLLFTIYYVVCLPDLVLYSFQCEDLSMATYLIRTLYVTQVDLDIVVSIYSR